MYEGESIEISSCRWVMRIRSGGQPGDQRSNRAVIDPLEVHAGAFAVAVDHTGFGEQLEVAGDSRLRLAENLGQVGDRQFTVGQEQDNSKTCLFADRPQHVEGGFGRESHAGTI